MALRISENLTISFGFAKDGLVGHWLRWIILIVVTAIPILDFITLGYLVKIFKGGNVAPELEGYLGMFVDGIKLAIIALAYLIIPIVLIVAGIIFAGGVSAATGLILILIGIVLALILGFVGPIGAIRFAKTERMREGVNFKAIFATIKEIGWGHYILSYIVLVIVLSIVAVIIGILIGILEGIFTNVLWLGWLIPMIVMPVFLLWKGKFYENLYSRA